MTENDYVATATAEKRLRELLAERFSHHTEALVTELGDRLLANAEITYLPRKKSVSITLRYPETASQNGGGAATPPAASSARPAPTGDEAAVESATGTPPPAAPSSQPKVARFGEFVPTATSNESDYFAE